MFIAATIKIVQVDDLSEDTIGFLEARDPERPSADGDTRRDLFEIEKLYLEAEEDLQDAHDLPENDPDEEASKKSTIQMSRVILKEMDDLWAYAKQNGVTYAQFDQLQ